ncbi:hypothetical protein V6N13_058961 [Hibiscus sabdariffa]
MHGSRSHASSSKTTVMQKPSIMDSSKHQVISLPDNDHLSIPAASITGSIVQDDQVAMQDHFNCQVKSISDRSSTLVCFVHASLNSSKRKHLWNYMSYFSTHIHEKWTILGDFNANLSPKDRKGCSPSSKPDQDFIDALFDVGLHDIGYYGPDFTCLITAHLVFHYPFSSTPPSTTIQLLRQIELKRILDHKELIWKQKPRSDWIKLGDRDTSYFHKNAILNKCANRITSLKIKSGSWCDDEDILHEEASEFFQQLFELDTHNKFPLSGLFSIIPSVEMLHLEFIPDASEIRDTLFAMAPLKSPDPDGLHAQFFQTNWDIVGGSIYAMISNVFSGQDIDPRLNSTILFLIPKVLSSSS